MNKIILHSSAFVALIKNEPGQEIVEPLLHRAIISSVNLAEIISELNSKLLIPENQIQKIISLIPEIYPFDKKLAINSGLLEQNHSHLGLSLGDRACLALASQLSLPIYTANQAWEQINIGVTINQIR